MLNFRRKLIQYRVLGNTAYSSDAKPYMTNKNKPLWEDFDSLIEQAVVHQKASLYSDLNEEMRWALAIAALRENKTEFEGLNQVLANAFEKRGSPDSLQKLYRYLVQIVIEGNSQSDAFVAHCINCALEKEEQVQTDYAAEEIQNKGVLLC